MRIRLVSCIIITFVVLNVCSLSADDRTASSGWSLQKDLSFFVNYQFDSVLFYHGLKPLKEINNQEILFYETPDCDTRRLAGERKEIIADSLLTVSNERDRLYLQAYFNWLLLIIKEKVTDRNLFYAENTLYRKYPYSPHAKLLSGRINNYFHGKTLDLTMNAGLGWGFFTKDIDQSLGNHVVLELGMGLKIRKTLINFSLKHQAGDLTDDFKKENKDLRIDYVSATDNDHYSILSPSISFYYCLNENAKFSIMPMFGVQWSSLQIKNYDYPDINDVGLLTGVKLEYTLGATSNREEGSTFFGLLKYKTIISTIFKTYLEISYTHNKLSFLEEGDGSKLNITAGISMYHNERNQKNNQTIVL